MHLQEPTTGSRWRNRHTGRVDEVAVTGPCDNLDGELRVWLVDEQREWPSNGWALDQFARCWTPQEADRG